MKKKIVFLSGTRADFGKIKSLILGFQKNNRFKVSVFVTGMHLLKRYGSTIHEIRKSGIKNIFKFNNQKINERMNSILSNTMYIYGMIRTRYNSYHSSDRLLLGQALVDLLSSVGFAPAEGLYSSMPVDKVLR